MIFTVYFHLKFNIGKWCSIIFSVLLRTLGFYILSLVFTFKVFRMKSFRVSEGWLVSRSTLIPTSPSVIVQGSEQGIFW